MKKKLLIIPIIALFAIAVFLVQKKLRSHNNEGVLRVSGNVEITEVDMGFKVPGRVSELLTDEGAKVKKDDKLASLDSAELESEVAKAKAAVFESQAKLNELKSGSRPQEVKGAEADVKYAEAELEKAKKDLERADMLFKNGAISASQYDSFKKAYDISKAKYSAVSEKKSLIKEGPRKEDIRAAEFRVKQAEAALKAIEERFRDTAIYAPMDGVVLKKNIEQGETVGAGMPVFVIGDLENPWIKVYVKETNLGAVRLGQAAKIKTDTFPDKTYEGKVSYISSEAEFTPKNVQTQEERVKLVFGVKVSVKNINDELKPGMPTDVELILK